MQTIAELYRRLYYGISDFLAAEHDRLVLWLPVAFASGIGIYFALPREPSIFITSGIFICGLFLLWDGRKTPETRMFSLFGFLIILGFFLIQCRTYVLSMPSLKTRSGAVTVRGEVVQVTKLPENRARIVLKISEISGFEDWMLPAKLRINLKKETPVPAAGDFISFKAQLSPSFAPTLPGGFNFGRLTYFEMIGGNGFATEPVTIIKKGNFASYRQKIIDKFDALLPPETADIAKALVTGESKAIPGDIVQNYRDSGIAHVLSVSGLHMGLIAGFVFAVVRSVLALFPGIALRFDTKKIAAVIALAVTFFYLLLAGAPISARRAFIMLAIALTAILFNRRALSIVSVAWAAFIILLLTPESLISASFQMSFAAVIALIAAYEAGIGKYTRMLEKKESVLFYVLSCAAAILLTSAIASLATAPLTLYAFKRFPVYTLLGNLLSSTTVALWVMPSLLIGTLMMPFGAADPFYNFASHGIALMNKAAAFTAGLPHAVYVSPAMPFWGLLCSVFGGLWLCLWRTRVRYLGLTAFVIGLISPAFTTFPDVLASENVVAFKNNYGKLVFKEGKSDQLLRSDWMAANRQEEELTMTCPDGLCIYEKNGRAIGYAHTKKGAEAGCARTDLDVLFITADFTKRCPVPIQVIRFDLMKNGTYALYMKPSGIKIETVGGEMGFRPWVSAYPYIDTRRELAILFTNNYPRVDAKIVPGS